MGQFTVLLPLTVGLQQGIHPAHGRAEGNPYPGGKCRVDLDRAPSQGALHHQQRVLEHRRGPHGLLPGTQERVIKMIYGRHLPGNVHWEIRTTIKTGECSNAAFTGKGALPLLIELHPQRGYAVVADHHRPLPLHAFFYQGRN